MTSIARTWPHSCARCPRCGEVSIGHALISDALELGYAATVKAYLAAIDQASSGR